MFPAWSDWTFKYTPQGLARKRKRNMIRYALYALAIVGVYRARQQSKTLRDIPALLRGIVARVLLLGANGLQSIAGKL
jgi:hypothetical protein